MKAVSKTEVKFLKRLFTLSTKLHKSRRSFHLFTIGGTPPHASRADPSPTRPAVSPPPHPSTPPPSPLLHLEHCIEKGLLIIATRII